jgi:hypothetical protein
MSRCVVCVHARVWQVCVCVCVYMCRCTACLLTSVACCPCLPAPATHHRDHRAHRSRTWSSAASRCWLALSAKAAEGLLSKASLRLLDFACDAALSRPERPLSLWKEVRVWGLRAAASTRRSARAGTWLARRRGPQHAWRDWCWQPHAARCHHIALDCRAPRNTRLTSRRSVGATSGALGPPLRWRPSTCS